MTMDERNELVGEGPKYYPQHLQVGCRKCPWDTAAVGRGEGRQWRRMRPCSSQGAYLDQGHSSTTRMWAGLWTFYCVNVSKIWRLVRVSYAKKNFTLQSIRDNEEALTMIDQYQTWMCCCSKFLSDFLAAIFHFNACGYGTTLLDLIQNCGWAAE